METVSGSNNGRGTIIAHIRSMSTRGIHPLAKHAEAHGVNAISAVVPFYYKVSANEIREHYEAIMDASSLPMIIYHFPGATGVTLSMDFYEQMAKHPQCIRV